MEMANIIPSHRAGEQRNNGVKATNRQKKILAPSAKGVPTKAEELYRPAMQTSTWNSLRKATLLTTYKPDTNACYERE